MGPTSKTFNLATDYTICGKLIGSIFENDSLINKRISIPFNLNENAIIGSLFQLVGYLKELGFSIHHDLTTNCF